jgi:5'(3')-deoxyribonucleotidase
VTLTLGIDVDGVLADSLRPWVARLCAKHDIGGFTSDDVDRWDFWNQIGITEDEMWAQWTPDIYKDVLPYDDAYSAI